MFFLNYFKTLEIGKNAINCYKLSKEAAFSSFKLIEMLMCAAFLLS